MKLLKSMSFRLRETRRENKSVIRVIFSASQLFFEFLYYKLFKSEKFFNFQGKRYKYFYYPYNATWRNERAIEIPIILKVFKLNPNKKILEFGNVMKRYIQSNHDVLDKYEEEVGVINEDVVKIDLKKKYDLIISISTIEHVGWDEKPRDSQKVKKAISNLKSHLKKNGTGIITFPIGWNRYLDEGITKNILDFHKIYFMKRTSKNNNWKEASFDEIRGIKYGRPFRAANAIGVGIIKSK